MPLRRRRAARAATLALLLCPTAASRGAEPSPAERDRLAAGETVVRLAPAPALEAWAARVLEAPAERVARAAGDWRHYAEFFPFVERSEVGVEEGVVLVRQTVQPPYLFPRHRLVAVVDPDSGRGPDGHSWRLRWRVIGGDRGGGSGEWKIVALSPGRSRVELRLVSPPGGLPALERIGLGRTLPWALEGLAQQVRRCRYDHPRHATCREAPAFSAPGAETGR